MTTVAQLHGCASAKPLGSLEYMTSPDGDASVYYLGMPHGTVLVGVDLKLSVVAVFASQEPNARDWTETCMLLKALRAHPLGEPEFVDELDVWTVGADFANCDYPIVSAAARLYVA